eukprot:2415881-Alexandrium_andersonii.AAC.1
MAVVTGACPPQSHSQDLRVSVLCFGGFPAQHLACGLCHVVIWVVSSCSSFEHALSAQVRRAAEVRRYVQ